MPTITISKTYYVKWQLSFAPEYKWSRCGKCINSIRSVELKRVLKSGCVGYNIRGKFYALKNLRLHLEKIPKETCPF